MENRSGGNRVGYTPNRSSNAGMGNPAPQSKALDVTFYEGDRINPKLLDECAEKQAKMLHEKINSAQLRKFFGEIKNLYLRLENGRKWQDLEHLFRMIKSKAYYSSKTGGNSCIPDSFRAFITDNVDKVKNEKDFRAFVMYFEAVVGFAYGMGLVKK